MTLWEMAACVDGVNYANRSEDKVEPPTDEEFERMLDGYDHLNATPQ